MSKRQKLYHGSPHRLDEIRPATATGKGDLSAREHAIYLANNPEEARLYALTRPRNSKRKGWAILDKKVHYVKGEPINKQGYVYEHEFDDYAAPPESDPGIGYRVYGAYKPTKRTRVRLKGIEDQFVEHPDKASYKDAVKSWLASREKTSSVKHTLVTGHSGAGKSTLAKSFGLPIHALDDDPDIREQLNRQMAYARAHQGRLPLGKQYAKDMRRAEERAIERAMALKDPHVIEGSYLLNRDPEDFKAHNMHLVDTPEDVVLDRRVERQRVKDIARNRHWDDARAKGVRMRGQQLIDEYASGVQRWRDADYVKKAALKKDVKLRPHQKDALRVLRENKGRALFAHGTGTGKTLTSIASFEDLRARGEAKRALVVAPAALLTNFREQGVQKFTDSSVSAVGGNGDYQLVSLEKFRRDPQGVLDQAKADTLIIDEMHRSRNSSSSSFDALRTTTRDKRIKNVIGLTGSIVSNHPKDIVPLADIVRDKHGLGSQSKFTQEHVKVKKISGGFLKPPTTKYDLHKKDDLRSKVDGLIHYVGNNDMEGMPGLNVNDINVEMSKDQQRLYDFAMGKLNPMARARIRSGLPPSQSEAQHIFGMITKLRQASNSVGTHNNMSPAESAESTPKLKRVLDDVQEHIKSTKDGQVVVYSNLVNGGAKELYEGLKARGIQAGLYTGPNKDLGVTKASRDVAVRRFTAGKDRAIILTGAGGEGLSLNNATMFAAVDPHFNPERNWQAIARARRFGGLAHRLEKDRVIQVNRYQSTPRQSLLGKAIFGKEVGVDEWMQRVADEKDRLNAQVRAISQNVTDTRRGLQKQASREVRVGRKVYRPKVQAFMYNDQGHILAAKSQGAGSGLRAYNNYKFPGGGVEEGEEITDAARKELLEEAGYETGGDLFEFGTPTAVDWDKKFRAQARKKGRGRYAGQYEYYTAGPIGKRNTSLLGSEGDALGGMEFVPMSKLQRDLTRTANDPKNEYGYFDKQKLVALKALQKELKQRGVKTASFRNRVRSIEIPSELGEVADRYYQTRGQGELIAHGRNEYINYRNPRSKRTRRMEDVYATKTAEKGVATKSDPAAWDRAKAQARAKMGGKHSARAMQLATQIYKKNGGGYSGAKPSSGTNKLKKWTKQDWQWSGRDTPGPGGTGVYLPKRATGQLKSTDTGREKLRAAAAAKRAATNAGEQFSRHGLHVGKRRGDVRG